MDRIIRIILLTAVITLGCFDAAAQGNQGTSASRDELAESQANYIAKELAMDDATAKRFVDTYCDFKKELWNMGPGHKRKKESRTEAEAKEAIMEQFDHGQKILDIRKKYYAEYSKFLTQLQIEKVYRLEKRIMKRLSRHRPPRKK